MHHRDEQCMFAAAVVVLVVERDRLAAHRADVEADLAAQTLERDAGLLVDHYRQTHARLVDIGQSRIQRTGRAGLDAGDVVTHLARNVARLEIGRAQRHRITELGQLQRVIGTVPHAQAAAYAGRLEIRLVTDTRRTNRRCRQRPRLALVHTERHRDQADTRSGAQRVAQEAPACRVDAVACVRSVVLHSTRGTGRPTSDLPRLTLPVRPA